MIPICQYCQKQAVFVDGKKIYPHRPDLSHLRFWECEPCDAFVGCHAAGSFTKDKKGRTVWHEGTEPKGTLAKMDLRILRCRVHAALDPHWLRTERPRKARKDCYKRLAEHMGLPLEECHTGTFNIPQCTQALAFLKTWEKT